MKITINGSPFEVEPGQTLLRAARKLGFDIPSLCDHPDLKPFGGCRICVVELKGSRFPVASCALMVEEGMVVQTDTPALTAGRRFLLEQLLSSYHDAGYASNHANELLALCERFGVDAPAGMRTEPRYVVDSDANPFVWVDMNKCILCTRCVRACQEVQGRWVWGMAERGMETRITAGLDQDMLKARCESCGACAVYCPTGALDHKLFMRLGQVEKRVTTTCSYCGVGCNFDLLVQDDKVVGVESNPKAPVNGLALCVKGRYGHDYIHHPDRLLKPRVRRYLLEGGEKRLSGAAWEWVETDWETALGITAQRLHAARERTGPDSIGILTSAKCTNEENYLMNKLARQVLGTHNLDHCARL